MATSASRLSKFWQRGNPEKVEKAKGQAFNIGGGVENSLSILELIEMLENELNVNLNYKNIPWRKSDQKVFIADIEKAKKRLTASLTGFIIIFAAFWIWQLISVFLGLGTDFTG